MRQNERDRLLAALGELLYVDLLAGIVTCAMFGLYVLALCIAVYISVERGIPGRPEKFLWICLIVMMLCNMWNLGNGLVIIILDVKSILLLSEDKMMTVGQSFTRTISCALLVNMVIGDTIVAWRAWGIWRGSKSIARYFLVALMVGNIATSIADALIDILNDATNRTIVMDYVWSSLSLSVNFFATLLIALKAWELRHAPGLSSANNTKRTQLGRVLVLLIESGVVYCATQIAYVVLQFFTVQAETPSLQIWTLCIGQVVNGMAVLNPLAILIIISLERSVINKSHEQTASVVIDTLTEEQSSAGFSADFGPRQDEERYSRP